MFPTRKWKTNASCTALMALKAERTQHINYIKGLMASQGVQTAVGKDFLSRLEAVHLWDGSALLPAVSPD
jgi:hypothetical protein